MTSPSPVPIARSSRLRNLALALAAAAVAMIAWVVIARSSDRAHDGRRTASARPERGVGPSGGLFGGRAGRTGSARSTPDVWGALTAPDGTVRVEGQVIEVTTGEPVDDVDVVFAGPDGQAGETTATVDASGRYHLDVTPGTYRAFVRGDGVISVGQGSWERLPGAADATIAGAVDGALAPLLRVSGAQRGVDLSVELAGVVVGRVLDAGGRPVVGAAVRTLGGAGRRPVLGTDVTETDAGGAYRLEVPVGYYALDASHDAFGGLASIDPGGSGAPMVEVLPGQTSTMDLQMVAGCVISGRAVRPDGSAAGEGAIERGLGGADFAPAGRLDADGRFRFTTAIEEEITLRAWPWKAPPAPSQTVRCQDGGRHELTFVIPDDAPDLAGRIVDAQGAAVALAYVDVYGMSAGTMNQQERGDADGRWAVFALPPGEYAISAHVPGQGVAWAMATVPGPEVQLTLSGTGAIGGTVQGLDDGTFSLEIAGCAIGGGAVNVDRQTVLVPVRGGRYRVDGLPACRLSVAVRAGARFVMSEVTVEAGGLVIHDLDVSPPRAKTVRVRVRQPDGSPAAGAIVVAMGMDAAAQAPQPSTADGSGEVTVTAHVGDIVHAFIQDSGAMGSAQVSDAPGDREDVTITLEDAPVFDDFDLAPDDDVDPDFGGP